MSAARAITSTLISFTSSALMLFSFTVFIMAVSGAWLSASIGKLFIPQSRMLVVIDFGDFGRSVDERSPSNVAGSPLYCT